MNSVLILGASGMLGHTLFARLLHSERYHVRATARKADPLAHFFSSEMVKNITWGVDADNFDAIVKVMGDFKPDCVINCIGIIKQLAASAEHIPALTVNSLFPHRLAMLCKAVDARLIHISSDCVFDGLQGNYRETDASNASDLYGRTKFLGEVTSYPHCITLRTSIIGHELGTRFGLVEWFLSQTGRVNGFTKAIFSGFPTIELAKIIMEHVMPNQDLHGLYHVASDPISKYDLLAAIARHYGIPIEIAASDDFVADRSLNSHRFQQATGYVPPSWEQLVEYMHADFLSAGHYRERQTT